MKQSIGYVTVVVRDYDTALDFYKNRLGFRVVEDTPMDGGRRWILIAPPGSQETQLLLAMAASPVQETRVGNQTGDRVFLYLHTDDFHRDYAAMKSRGVEFLTEPREGPFGTVAMFVDLYRNKWDLVQLHAPPPSPVLKIEPQ
jgi:catechol 2,3-dioxygenase-like lactoylglutathione lyase family enzyme